MNHSPRHPADAPSPTPSPGRPARRGAGAARPLALAAALLAAAAAPAADLTCPAVSAGPVLDGALDDAAWQAAARLPPFTLLGGTNTTDATDCLILRDDAWFYLGARCRNSGMPSLAPVGTAENQLATRDDCLELFLDPGTAGRDYVQFILTFANVQAQRRHTGGKRDAAWTLPWRSAARRDGGGWTAELAVPLFLAVPRGDAGPARLNVSRTERRIELDAYGAFLKDELVRSSWRSVRGTYAAPAVFGAVDGLAGAAVRIPLLADLGRVEIGAYARAGGRQGYPVQAEIRSYSDAAGALVLGIADRPEDGPPSAIEVAAPVIPLQTNRLSVFVPVAAFGPRAVTVTLQDAAGAALRALTVSNPAVLTPMGEVLLDYAGYTVEPAARLRCRLGLPQDTLAGLAAVARLAGGAELARAAAPGRDLELAVPLAAVPLGAHTLRLTLEDGAGAVLAARAAALVKREPRPGREVKANRFRGVLEKNGAAVFPFGFVKIDVSAPALRAVAAAGHTAILRWNNRWDAEGAASLTQLMETARAAGLDVVDKAEAVLREHLPDRRASPFNILPRDPAHQRELLGRLAAGLEAARPALAAHARSLAGFPNLLGYYNVDEPNLMNREARMAGARGLYAVLREADPWRPVFTLFAREIPPGGLETGDAIGYDVYNYPGFANRFYGQPSYMSDQVIRLKRQAEPAGKPVFLVLMSEGLDPLRCPRLLLPEEQRCQTYLAIIHGARGLFYFTDVSLYTQAMWDTLADLARQVAALAPAVTAGAAYPPARTTPVALDPDRQVYPDVQAALFRDPAGGGVLLAANAAYHPVDAAFSIPGLDPRAPVARRFGGDPIAPEGDTFRDTLEPLATRAYVLALRPAAPAPAAWSLALVSHPDRALPLKWFNPASDFKHRRNGAANPSFEDAALPGIPDYVRPAGEIPVRMGRPGGGLTLDPGAAVHGGASLRETVPLPSRGRRGFSSMAYLPAVTSPTPIVLSAYIKASANLKQAYLSLAGMDSDQAWRYPDGRRGTFAFVEPTPAWQRVIFAGRFDPARLEWVSRVGDRIAVPFAIGPGNMGFVGVQADAGAVEFWVDAVQIELGDRPTDFTTE